MLITSGNRAGEEGVCLGMVDGGRFAVAPDRGNAILTLEFETDFGLLVDLSANPSAN